MQLPLDQFKNNKFLYVNPTSHSVMGAQDKCPE